MAARRAGKSRRAPQRANRLRSGEAIAAGSALALFVLMFVTWFGSEVSGQSGRIVFEGAGAGGSAWQSLDWIPLFLMLTIATVAGAVVLRLSGSDWKPAIAPGAAVAVLGGIATLLVLFRILVPPSFGTLGGVSVEATVKLGVFLGLAAAAGIAYGGYRAMGEEDASFAKVAERLKPSR
jgi:hypothetical protein